MPTTPKQTKRTPLPDVPSPQVFHFTPSLMSAETLEKMLVQRHPLAQRLTDLIRDSSTPGAGKQHTYLVGPRGIGKTHLIALTYHRIKAMDDLRDQVRIAWLREEEWGTESFTDLLMRICRALKDEYPDEFPAQALEQVFDAPKPDAHVETLLKSFIGNRTLLLLMENVDEIFAGIKDKGQKQFRAFLQNTAFTTVLATSQGLSPSISSHAAPFYNFFRVLHLTEFSVDDAVLLLQNLAQLRGDKELADFVDSTTGRARVRAVNHLAGGNPRLYVIFSDFLTRESLDDLVKPFLKMLDELTPYYQARIGSLSTQQQKIVGFLCDNAAPATVKEIARRCFITQQTASGQLKDLKGKNFVCADPLGPTGRDTYYELCEPLMRLCLEVKKSRSGPIRLMIEFLRLWYPVPELRHQLDLCKPNAPVEREYLSRALELAETSEDPRVRACKNEFHRFFSHADFSQALTVAEDLISIAPDWESYNKRSLVYLFLGELQKALEDVDTAISLCEFKEVLSYLWTHRAKCLRETGLMEAALSSTTKALTIYSENEFALRTHAEILVLLEKHQEALPYIKKSLKIEPKDAHTLKLQGSIYGHLGQYEKAARSLDKAIKINPEDMETWSIWLTALSCYQGNSEYYAAVDKALHYNPENPRLWYDKAEWLKRDTNFEQAIYHFENAINYQTEIPCGYFGRAECYLALQAFAKALADVEKGLLLISKFSKQDSTTGEHCLEHTQPILGSLLRYTSDIAQWSKQIKYITNAYQKYGFLAELAPALSSLLNPLLSDRVSQTTAEAWNEAWKQTLASPSFALPEFDLPLRLMQTAVDYKTSRDKKVLLRLPIEERKIIEAAQARNEEAQPPVSDEADLPESR